MVKRKPKVTAAEAKPSRRSGTSKLTLAQLNRKMSEDADRVERLAKANTLRLTDKPSL